MEPAAVTASENRVLNLRAGELVEVRSEAEILRTLDKNGRYESLPFMPEMREFCGRQFRVYKRADKACDTIEWKTLRRMQNAVHLEELRCNGTAHGGCQAGCLIFWKEAWLKRVDDASDGPAPVKATSGGATPETLTRATRAGVTETGEELFSCQATQLRRATTGDVPFWDPRQYVRDVRSGNAEVSSVVRGLLIGFFNKFQQLNAKLLPRFCLLRGCKRYPFVEGTVRGETPKYLLDLQPGEIVEVKSKEEIYETLDEADKNRGLRYDSEMLKYSGGRGKVLRRVEHIIDEKTGKMLHIKGDCIILDGVICTGDYHRSCPRSIYPYWREIWLKRVDQPEADRPTRSA
jgi:hypothetical protein